MFWMCAPHSCCVFMDVCFVLFLFCLYICVCVTLQIQGPLRECHPIRSGICGLSYYCAPLLCVPAVIGVLAVWQHNKPKTKQKNAEVTLYYQTLTNYKNKNQISTQMRAGVTVTGGMLATNRGCVPP